MPPSLTRRLLAESLGSAALTAIVVGSGIAAQRLSPRDVGLELLENAIVTGLGLYVLIVVFARVSGAHFNPVVTLVSAASRGVAWRDVPAYVLAQVLGCVLGAMTANAMFSRALISLSTHHRASGAHLLAEAIATAGLVVVIFALVRTRQQTLVAAAVGCYIAAAYFFTSSTSFANPAITVGRLFSNSFAGIAPASAPAFIIAQLLGGAGGGALVAYLFSTPEAP